MAYHVTSAPFWKLLMSLALLACGCGPESGETMGSATDSSSETDNTTGETTGTTSETDTSGEGMSVSLIGGGYYYGECGGACRGEMSFNDETIEHVVSGWEDDTYGTWTGMLTSAGAAERAALELLLGTIEIEQEYGCPDGADGGGGFLILEIDGVMLRTDYPLDGACEEAPAEILATDAFLSPIMAGFAQCMATDAFIIDEPCTPVATPVVP